MNRKVKEMMRYAFWGMANTLLGIGLILIIQLLTGSPYAANLAGFLIGSITSYLIHAKFTFNSKKSIKGAATYLAILTGCYLANLVILRLLLPVMNVYICQGIAIAGYAILSYILQSNYAFKGRRR
jgi:putative flippase GtrA